MESDSGAMDSKTVLMRRSYLGGMSILACLCCLSIGCGSGNSLGRTVVAGDVTLDGQPVEKGNIQFRPHQQRGVGSGAVIRDGHYEMETAKGLPPGDYLVRIFSPVPLSEAPTSSQLLGPEGMMVNAVERVPEKYNKKSTLLVTVEGGVKNTFDFEMDSK